MYIQLWVSSQLTFAGMKAFKPRVIEVGVAFISTLLEPSTATSATTEFAGSLDGAALEAYGTECRYACRRG